MSKKETGVQIKSWNDVNYQIAEIREKEQTILQLQRDYDDQVLTLQKRFMNPKSDLQDEVNFIKGKMKDFCDANRKDMEDQRKKVLPSGEVYYRALPVKIKVLEGLTELSVIKKLKACGTKYFKKYVSLEPELSLNAIKKDLKELTIDDKFLKAIGLESETGENFNVKANP